MASFLNVASRNSRARTWTLVALMGALSMAGCRKDAGTGPSATPTSISIQSGTGQTGVVGTVLGTMLSVIVTDAGGAPISGARVEFSTGAGAGTVSPSAVNTNSSGIAQTTWTLGSTTGTLRVTAGVSGVAPVVFTATATSGAASVLVATPDRAFLGQGDTVRIRASARDQFGNEVSGQAITFTALDATIATVSSAGLVTAVGQGTGRISIEGGGRTTIVNVTVGAPGSSVCGPVPVRPLVVGEVFTPEGDAAGVRTCLIAPLGVNAEYALTLINTVSTFSVITPIDVYAVGNTAPLTAIQGDAFGLRASADVQTVVDAFAGASLRGLSQTGPTRQLDEPSRVELERRAEERRALTALVPSARAWQAERARFPSLIAEPKVGDQLTLNANASQACSAPVKRTGRVVAIGTRSVVVADIENPTGGYSDAEYASVGATFDTLVYPLDTTAFGAPSNVSGFGKIILFFTRSVNALTPPSTSSYTIGGFFFARDLYPKTARNGLAGCAESNELEMFYLLVPDPEGTVNNNRRSKDEVTTLNLGTITHEFEHLINSGRRLYVNTSAVPSEETWLDEGLAHTAEELLYFRISGRTSRENLNLTQVTQQSSLFTNYASQNFSRFYQFLINPEANSPYAPNDSLGTRGATWNFLRFAAGRQGAGGESAFYRALVNSTTSGRTNLANVLGGQASLADYLRDWTVSLIADDYSASVMTNLDARYIYPAWNFRSIYPGLRFGGGSALGIFPLNTRSLVSGIPQRIALAGGTSSYVRFGLQSGRSTLISMASNGAAMPTAMRWAIVRLR